MAKTTYKVDVGATSVEILPSCTKTISALTELVSHTAVYGEYRRFESTAYFCVSGGATGTPAPTHTYGISAIGSSEWLALPKHRNVGFISSDGAGIVWTSKDGVAIAGEGVPLDEVNRTWETTYQGSVAGITDGGTYSIAVQV